MSRSFADIAMNDIMSVVKSTMTIIAIGRAMPRSHIPPQWNPRQREHG